MNQIFRKINVESRSQLNGKYTLRFEFGRECREFQDLTEDDLYLLARGITFAPEAEYEDARQLELLRREALENDNTGY
jgi:hypothetical protein